MWISHRYTYVSSPWTHSPPRLTSLGWQSTSFGFPASYSKFPLSIYFTYGNVYVSMLLSHIISLSFPTVSKSLRTCTFKHHTFFLLRQNCRMTDFKAGNICRYKYQPPTICVSCKQITYFDIQIPIWNRPWEVTREHQDELLLLREHYLLNCIALINQRTSSY